MKVIMKAVDAEEVLEWLVQWKLRNFGSGEGSCQSVIASLINSFAEHIDEAKPFETLV